MNLSSTSGCLVGDYSIEANENKAIKTSLPTGIYIARVMTDDKLIKVEKIFIK
jgi:hypothetical protein